MICHDGKVTSEKKAMKPIADMGPTGKTVAANVRRLREERGLTYVALSARVATRNIPPLALRRIESLARRIDVDDLVALAVALDVNPNALLFPPGGESFESAEVTALGDRTEDEIWRWALGQKAIEYSSRLEGLKGLEGGKHLFALQELEDQEFRDRVLPEAFRG